VTGEQWYAPRYKKRVAQM